MSAFDELFSASAAPSLVNHFGDERSVSVFLGPACLVSDATGIIRSQEVTEDYEDDQIIKRVEMEVDMLVDETQLPDGGLARITTSAKVEVTDPDGTMLRWNIGGMRNRTRTMVTLRLHRRLTQEQSTSGLRRREG